MTDTLSGRPHPRDALYHAEVIAAGYIQKTALVNEVHWSYVEGLRNGPSLVLLHAQLLDWFSYSRVLAALSRSFHVIDIDYPAHGKTTTAVDYPMTASRIGSDLADFIEKKVGTQVFITGNSSGGLLAAWLAANRPSLIRAVVLEDPPLFSSEYPRIKQTIAQRAFKTSHTAVANDHPNDFLLYWIRSNARFFRNNVGPGISLILAAAIRRYRKRNPGKPVELALVEHDTVRMMLRGLDQYDPRFGAAFFDGTWGRDFNHTQALEAIACPTLLMQANTSLLPDGTLNGAMTADDAMRATSLLKNGHYTKVEADHVINLEKPDVFVETLERFLLHR